MARPGDDRFLVCPEWLNDKGARNLVRASAIQCQVPDGEKFESSYPEWESSMTDFDSSVHVAVENLDVEQLRRLLDAGADVNEKAWDGMTLLAHAVDSESHALHDDVPLHADCTALLLARGADATIPDNGGMTALELAEQTGHWLAVELIRAFGMPS